MNGLDVHLEIGTPLVRGALALYPLFGDGPVAPPYVAGPDAAAAGTVTVAEREGGPEVPELSVANGAPCLCCCWRARRCSAAGRTA